MQPVMLIPKASHLVERVAERLLRSGALDESSAQLLRQPGGEAPGGEAASDAAAGDAPAGGEVASNGPPQRSSLFMPPPSLARAPPRAFPVAAGGVSPRGTGPAPSSDPTPAGGVDPTPTSGDGPTPTGGEGPTPTSGDPGPAAPPLAAPAIHGQPGQATAPGRPEDFSLPVSRPNPLAGLADPAAGMLQGPASVDAVSLERAGMVDWSRTRTRISEEFRLVQRQIIRSAFGPGAEPGFSNLLLVTSARPGEGKSFMATNLSGSIARQGDHHVLLVDADSKRDSICYSLGLAQSRGLLDLAANPKLDPAPLIVKTPIERLSILPVGRERERSAELFSTKEMTRLIQSLGRRYADRLLILDAPPCLSTSDPAVLAQVVGQILFVVEADRTQRDEIEASLDLIQACPTITMVLNKQQISSRYTFGAYSSYYSS
jgi:receptor protein-tyrosine kinase